MRRPGRRGVLLVTLLMLLVVMLMWSAALFKLNRGELVNGSHYRDRARAFQLARGGLNHAAELLTADPAHTTDITWGDSSRGYEVRFSGPPEIRSINNLNSLLPSTDTNFRGETVPGTSADIIVVAWYGDRRVAARGLLKRGFLLNASVSSTDQVILDGDTEVSGIASLDDPTPRGGGIVSVYRSTAANDHAVNWIDTGSGSFVMNGETTIQSGPESDAAFDSISANLKALYPDRADEGSANQPPPRYDVAETVVGGSSHPLPDDAVLVGGSYRLGYTHLNDERYVNGGLVVTGDLNLAGGTLYVNGDLTLNGGIHGIGSIFVDGNISVNGGNSVVFTNQSNGAALFSSQNVNLTGIDASGYLDSLAGWYPNIGAAKTDFETAYTAVESVANRTNPTGADALTLWALTQQLSWDQVDESSYFVNPIAGPSGTHPIGSPHRPIPQLLLAIKNSLGPAYQTDVKAQKIVQAMEQTHYNFRFNYENGPAGANIDLDTYTIPGTPPSAFYPLPWAWDDDVLLPDPLPVGNPADLGPWDPARIANNGARFKDLTIDHKYRASGGNTFNGPHLDELRAQMFAQTKAFMDVHPLDFAWLGDSYFQGLVYAQGQIAVDNRFRVIGGLVAHDQVRLSGGSSLTYNDEYRDYVGATGPVYAAAYEEL